MDHFTEIFLTREALNVNAEVIMKISFKARAFAPVFLEPIIKLLETIAYSVNKQRDNITFWLYIVTHLILASGYKLFHWLINKMKCPI